MVRLVTDMKYVPEASDDAWVIKLNDAYFGYRGAKYLGDKELEYMKKIDNATLIDRKLGTVVVENFGTTDLKHLSTGLKTLLNLCIAKDINEHKLLYIELTECGKNVLDYIFEELDKADNIIGILRHPDVNACSLAFEINGKNYGVVDDLKDLLLVLRGDKE